MGIAEGIDYPSLKHHSETIKTLLKVLEDPSYALNAQKISARFKDQKEKPLDRAIWWIEWLIRNPNCEYLKSPVLRLGFVLGNAYDIIAFISTCVGVLLMISLYLFCFCISKCTRGNIHSSALDLHKKAE